MQKVNNISKGSQRTSCPTIILAYQFNMFEATSWCSGQQSPSRYFPNPKDLKLWFHARTSPQTVVFLLKEPYFKMTR
jgi:hypothetical protein